MRLKNFKQYLNETKKAVRNSLIQPSDEEIQSAEIILNQGADPDWDITKFGYFYIDVSGKYSVYYTLWRFKPSINANAERFITNLSTDFMTAVQKGKKAAGRVPIIIDKYGTQAGLFNAAKAEILTYGKYRGKSLGEIFVDDPQYLLWLCNNDKNPDRAEKLQYYKELYFETITKKNIEESKSKHIGSIGDKIKIQAKIYSVETSPDMYSNNKINYKCKMVDDDDNKYMTYSIGKKIEKGNTVILTGKVKDHKELLGVKFTILNYCKVISVLEDELNKFNM